MGLDLSTRLPLPLKEKSSTSDKRVKVLVLAGPTGVGKTALSLKIAQAVGGEIISADSVQIYRGLDIGTAKVGLEERKQVPHYLIDIRDLDETFNVVDFYEYASQALEEISLQGAAAIVVGGTGFYIDALIHGAPSGPPSVPTLRLKLENDMEKFGSEALFDKLRRLDPEYAQLITERDRHKIIRALEIILLTNKKVSQFTKMHTRKAEKQYDFRCWFVFFPKEILYERLDRRCEKMVAMGLLEEVHALEKKGLRENTSASQAIGYRQCLEYLSSPQTERDWEKFMSHFKQASRRYAKRQFTWFRKDPLFHWLDLSSMDLEKAAEIIIQDFEKG
jgi:tRNA dimethylallyltransferase